MTSNSGVLPFSPRNEFKNLSIHDILVPIKWSLNLKVLLNEHLEVSEEKEELNSK